VLDKNVTFPFSLQRKKIVRVKVTHVGKGSFNNEKISDLNEGFNRFCFVVFTFDSYVSCSSFLFVRGLFLEVRAWLQFSN